ncbi:MAG: glycogen synthase [Bacteroidetes bacterium SW_8_64_56]|nr:MAG: glycogen synthase [Bacteroidetes bacterium SW_8_64_56]
MAASNRLLYVAGALFPFTERSPLASLTRSLPEQVQGRGNFEVRIMMPCYGDIDERKHNLHEVIRLSDTEVPMGTKTETVSVKVASVPDVQLQVYFMDHDGYFDRNGYAANADGTAFDDNADRALFFGRSVMKTLRKLRWGPDVVHSFGWISGLLPSLLSTTDANDDLFGSTKSVFTPSGQDPEARLGASFAERKSLPLDGNTGSALSEIGHAHADATIVPPGDPLIDGAPTFSENAEARTDQAVTLYDQMLGEVPA